ncbi:MAG: eL32 family ribosomal protein [Nanoarchaeota archaeon]
MVKFLRRTWSRFSKLGRKRKSKQVWRRPTGRHNKIREKRKGYPAKLSIGYRGDKKDRWKIEGKNVIIVNNLADLEKIKKEDMIIIGKIGRKKKMDIAKIVKEKKLQVYNLNTEKFLDKWSKKKEVKTK